MASAYLRAACSMFVGRRIAVALSASSWALAPATGLGLVRDLLTRRSSDAVTSAGRPGLGRMLRRLGPLDAMGLAQLQNPSMAIGDELVEVQLSPTKGI